MTRGTAPRDRLEERQCICPDALARLTAPLSERELDFIQLRLHTWAVARTPGDACATERVAEILALFAADGERYLDLRPVARRGAWTWERMRVQRQAERLSLPPDWIGKCTVKAALATIEEFAFDASLDAWFDYLLVPCRRTWLKEKAPASYRDPLPPVAPDRARVALVRDVLTAALAAVRVGS